MAQQSNESAAKILSSMPLVTRDEVVASAMQIWQTAKARIERPGRFAINLHTTWYSRSGAEMEGWSRQLWSIVPLLAGGSKFPDLDMIHSGLIAGVDPDSASYWGTFIDNDQRMVECAVLGCALKMLPELMWHQLPDRTRQQLAEFLYQINSCTVPNNNWNFFRLLVNSGLTEVGVDVPEAIQQQTLQTIESFYLDDGWYGDGKNGARDYYNPFGFHFYSLLYARWFAQTDPDRARVFRERATLMTPQFLRWFDPQGAALPYGRSQTYRFGQASYWSALAYAGDYSYLTPGQVKGLVLRNLRWWLSKPICNSDGTLSRGYGYPQDAMTDFYNAEGSPYWGLKTYWILALPEHDAFWQEAEQPLPELEQTPSLQKHPRLLIDTNVNQDQVVAACAGQVANPWIRHAPEKYAKMSYSSQLGIAFPSSRNGLAGAAPDNTVVISRDNNHWMGRTVISDFTTGDDWIASTWQIDSTTSLRTTYFSRDGWQLRCHEFCNHSAQHWYLAEGGYALPVGDEVQNMGQVDHALTATSLIVGGGDWTSFLLGCNCHESMQLLPLDPLSHCLFTRSVVPIKKIITEQQKICWVTVVGASYNQVTDALRLAPEWSESRSAIMKHFSCTFL